MFGDELRDGIHLLNSGDPTWAELLQVVQIEMDQGSVAEVFFCM